MKVRVTKKTVMEGFAAVVRVGYCSLQYLLYCEQPVYYTTRREGWGADIYDFGGSVAICTGYAPFGNVSPSYEICEKYDKIAAEIVRTSTDYQIKKAKLRRLISEFVKEVQEGQK